jgi:hypothetical protein
VCEDARESIPRWYMRREHPVARWLWEHTGTVILVSLPWAIWSVFSLPLLAFAYVDAERVGRTWAPVLATLIRVNVVGVIVLLWLAALPFYFGLTVALLRVVMRSRLGKRFAGEQT